MIVTDLTPPSATVADLAVGDAFIAKAAGGWPWSNVPCVLDDGGGATRLDTGQRVANVQATWLVEKAPAATVSMFP